MTTKGSRNRTKEPVAADAQPTLVVEPGDEHDSEARGSLLARVRESYRQSVGRWSTDVRTTQTLMQRLVDVGTVTQKEALRLLTEAQQRIDTNRSEVKAQVEKSVDEATLRLRIPTVDDVNAWKVRIAKLEADVDRLEMHKRANTPAKNWRNRPGHT